MGDVREAPPGAEPGQSQRTDPGCASVDHVGLGLHLPPEVSRFLQILRCRIGQVARLPFDLDTRGQARPSGWSVEVPPMEGSAVTRIDHPDLQTVQALDAGRGGGKVVHD